MQQAVAAYRRADWPEAERLCRLVLDTQSDKVDALHLLAVIAIETRRAQEALELATIAVSIDRNRAGLHCTLGYVLQDLKRHAEALDSYDRAIELKPNFVEALYNRGNALRDLKRFADAVDSYDGALKIKPNYAEALYNRGNALRDMKRHAEALESYDRALDVRPNYAQALNNRGNALCDLGRVEEALESYDRALRFEPRYAEALYNRGNALRDLKRPVAALESYNRAIEIKPDYTAAHCNLSLCCLELGDFARGWQEYEWRWKEAQFANSRRDFAQPLWLGAESLEGRTILLHSEQGLGDTLQFCRYARLVGLRGASVVLEVPPALLTLLAGLEGVTQVLAKGEALPSFDYHCPLLSLPLAFKTEPNTIPAEITYIRSDAGLVSAWQDRLGSRTKPRVGVVWSGSTGRKNDHRSMTLEQMLPLMSEQAEWVSLQKEVRSGDAGLLASRADIRHFGDELENFADTAAAIALMDIVVTIDTSVTHLAGAMGKALWILLPFNPGWRWLPEREDSAWYPTARLFRQPAIDDWVSVIDKVRGELAQELGARR